VAVVKITQGLVERQPFSTDGTRWLFDKELRGFALAVGKTTKTFYASCEANGRTLRRKIGRAAVLTAPQARTLAREMLVDLRRGIDARRPTSETLAAALETYLQRRRLKATSARQYRVAFNLYLRAWLNRDILSLTRAEVDQRHRAIGRTAPYSANLVFRILRAVLADARKRGVLTDNACDAIAWYPEARRQTRIGARLPEWAAAVDALPNPVRRAYYWLVLLTGLRRNEVACLRRDDVDLEAGTVFVRDPKRGPSLTLPLAR
jgi:integrase